MTAYADKRLAEAEAAGDQAQVRYWRRVKARVDAAPPLSPAVRDKLSILLRPEPVSPAPRQRTEPRNAKAA